MHIGRPSPPSRARLIAGEPGLLVLVCVTAAIDAVASIIRHVHLGSGLDLGLADQAVWHYSRFQAPFSSILHKDVLGDHFSPLVALLTPLYWVWSDPRMLLIAQSILVAVSIVPVFLFARPRLGRAGAYLASGAYAAFWGIQVGVLYDFHELAFAPLLIAFAILFADRRRWLPLWVTIVLLLAVKEDLSMFVVFFGVYLLTLREWRHGLALIAVGIVWYELATRILIPHFSGGAAYAHWTYGQLGKNLPSALGTLITHPWRLFTIAFSPTQKVKTMLALFAPFLFLSFASRLLILALPLLAERFLSTDTAFWSTHFHYSLAVSPVLAMAAIAGLSNLGALLAERIRPRLALAAAGAMLVACIAVTEIGSSDDSALASITRTSFLNTPSYVRGLAAAQRTVPGEASLLTIDAVLPHLSERRSILLIGPRTAGGGEYLLTRVVPPQVCCATAAGTYGVLGNATNIALEAMTPVYFGSGWLVARRPAAGQRATNGVLTPMTAAQARLVVQRLYAVDTAYGDLYPCATEWQARDARAASCYATVGRRFMSTSTALRGTLERVRRQLIGGCAVLAHAAHSALDEWSVYVNRYTAAAESSDRAAVPAAATLVQDAQTNLALISQIQRFPVLCDPRS